MQFLVNKSTNPFFNLALEEYLLKNVDIRKTTLFFGKMSLQL